MLALRLALSKGIIDVPLLRISSQNYEACKGCLIRRHSSLPTWYPRKLKNGHRTVSSPSVRWQTDGSSKGGANDSTSKHSVIKATADDVDKTTNSHKESVSSPSSDDDGNIVISFDYKKGLPLHHQLKKCMEDKTLRITHTKGKEINIEDDKFSWPVNPKRRAKKLFKEDEKFIEEERALKEYLLEPRHLKKLRSRKTRNAYRNTDKKYIIMYSITDLHDKAIEVWGSTENMQRMRRIQRLRYNYRYPWDDSSSEKMNEANRNLKFQTIKSASGKVVISAIAANLTSAGFKGYAYYRTGSDSMFAEMVHSIADAFNQMTMLFGLYTSNKAPDSLHPYGFRSLRYLFSFFAGIYTFLFGGLINIVYGSYSFWFMSNQPFHYSVWAAWILIASTLTEGGSLFYAYLEALKKMDEKERGLKGFKNFIQHGVDPSTSVVLLEDSAAVLGNLVALLCYYVGSSLGYTWVDSLGSLMIGGLLGVMGMILIKTNYSALIERSVSPEVKEAIQNTMEIDPIVRSVHDMKVVNDRVKAEIDYNGREITREYLSGQNMPAILQEMQFLSSVGEAEEFLLYHGDDVINQLGKRVDELEARIKAKHTNVRHVDLESL